jgi:hypothetical protein
MKLSFLQALTEEPGPWAGVYLDTSRDIDDPDRAIALRLRHQRDTLLAQGADHDTVSALEAVAGKDSEVPGRHGQALFATHGRVALAAALPEPPVRDTARFGVLPDAMPLALQWAPDIPYLAVALTRPDRLPDSAEEGGPVLFAHQLGRWPASRAAPGHRTAYRVPSQEWRHAARRLARELAEVADREHVEAVVLRRDAGDSWASGVLVNRLPVHLQNSLTVVEDDDGADIVDDGGRALIEGHVAAVLHGRLSTADQRHVDVFHTQRARHRTRSEGASAVVAALRRGQAQAVLVSLPVALPERLWISREPVQFALSADELEAFGAHDLLEEPADTVLLNAALRTGADLVVLTSDEDRPPADGLGVVLRYQDVAARPVV